jgi:hypothetical protein
MGGQGAVDPAHEEISRLESEKAYLDTQATTLEQKLASKEIKKKEYDNLVRELFLGKTKEEVKGLIDEKINSLRKEHEARSSERMRKSAITAGSAIALVLVLAFAGFFYANSGITGFSVFENPVENTYNFERTFNANTEETLQIERLLGLRISGTIQGSGATVRLVSGEDSYVVANLDGGSSVTYSLSTDQAEYNLGESIDVTVEPAGTAAALYVTHNDENAQLETTSFTPNETGTYTFFAIITTDNDIYRLEVNTTVVAENAAEGIGQTSTATENTGGSFSAVCDETCLLQDELTNPTLVVSLEEGSTLTIDELLVIEVKTNEAPAQIQEFANISLATGESVTIALADYFNDSNEDEISYDFSQIDELDMSILGDSLEITSNTPGEYTGHVYATDGLNLVNGNDFTITVTGDAVTPDVEDNTTENTTAPEETPANNATITNETTTTEENLTVGNATDTEAPLTLTDCNDPNPNRRPLSCIEGAEADYFSSRPIYLENAGREQVARITTFGNIIITGELVERSTARPSSSDFRISYLAGDGQTEITTAWIDSATGNLNLVGEVFEEQFSLVPPTPDAYQVQNQKGTTLAYFDRRSGDLYLRGNVVVEKPAAALTPVEQVAQV